MGVGEELASLRCRLVSELHAGEERTGRPVRKEPLEIVKAWSCEVTPDAGESQ